MSSRREFLQRSGVAAYGLWTAPAEPKQAAQTKSGGSRSVILCLCGDVMTGRGIDQILPHPSDPHLYEPHVKSASGYVELAERASGPIPKPVDHSYVWGDALEELARAAPDLRMVNLETSVTTSEDRAPKAIHYRMHPANIACLTAARIDCCGLANNHVLDWGHSGLAETLETLRQARVKTAGAGRNRAEAQEPAIMEVPGKGRVLAFAFGTASSGIPGDWAATDKKPGVAFLPDLSQEAASLIGGRVSAHKRSGDIAVVSIHWGENWGYEIPPDHIGFAHELVDRAAVDVIYGHSSHHPKGIEVYKDKPILYGCGDFLNDYEGIGGYEEYRSQLVLMYFLTVDPSTQNLVRLEMKPLAIRRFRLHRVSRRDAEWLRDTLHREGKKLGTQVQLKADNTLVVGWRK
ncbi:MAG: CapA family protein [Acidobacteria bacterium]|nr:CapA family protein [Acidobacteriota bacterium]